jgi:tetratricopeptide (TPR) repeat protein
VVSSPSDFDQALAPLVALRQRYPNNLWVNERYQDAVQQYGIEGHVRKLTEDYQVLAMQHPDDPTYSYLYSRSLMGRNTSASVQQLTELIKDHPDFAPAHGSLAEIYASATFYDESKEKLERALFLALCPNGEVKRRPAALPDPSLLIDQAESLLAQNGEPDRIVAMADQGVRDDEWRLQRIRPFDWYSVEYKRQAQRDLQAKYWKLWSIEVRCYRRAGRPEKAAQVLAAMDQRAAFLRSSADKAYWDVLALLTRLYEEGNQKDLATEKLKSMRDFLAAHPDPQKSVELEDLQKLAVR